MFQKFSKNILHIVVLLFLVYWRRVHSADDQFEDIGEDNTPGRYEVLKFKFAEVTDVYAITLWILLGSLAKIGFHLSHRLTERLPESCLLIILGLIVGGLFYLLKLADQSSYILNSETFFLYLLPPIILEAGYFMPNRPFFDNIGTILLFAIGNTLFNTFCIGLTLWGFSFTSLYGGVEFDMLPCFVFASLISAIDPVAVLAIFVEINVNDTLYIIVFGESLLNDAVSVVLYRMFEAFTDMGQANIQAADIALGATSFLVVSLGGVVIGLVFGFIATMTTKYTEKAPILEPLIVIAYAYLAYLTAEMTSTSSILAITCCGMFMKQYVEFNITKKSDAAIEYALKMGASIMETIIFIFMGLSTFSDVHSWNTGFVILTVLSCTVYRFIGVYIFGVITNTRRLVELKISDMLIMSYGGLRGAMAFALALILDENKIPRKKEFVTATIVVVYFTVFVQGITIGPLVKYLQIKRKEEQEPTMVAKSANRLIDHIMTTLELINGVSGKNTTRNTVRNFDRKFIKPLMLRELNSKDEKLLITFRKLNEFRMNQMADKPGFVLRPNQPGKSFDEPMPNAKTFKEAKSRRQSIFAINRTPKPNSEFHDLLDDAMFNPNRRGTLYSRLQPEDPTERMSRRKSRSNSVFYPSSKRPSINFSDLSSNVGRRVSDMSLNYLDQKKPDPTEIKDDEDIYYKF